MKRIACLLMLFLLTIASAEAGEKHGKFYLTPETFTGAQAVSACADGYHMASLWEIFDPSNLKYSTKLGLTTADSGSGPPADLGGWIRTGNSSFGNTQEPGQDNCSAWSSNSPSESGSYVLLLEFWNSPLPPGINILPWRADVASCDSVLHVWCVQDSKPSEQE